VKSLRQTADGPVAVVVGLDCITGLQTARLLSQRGVTVIAVATDRRHYCCRTRVCRQILTADKSSEDLLRCLEELGPSLPQKAVLFPCTDMSVLMISRGRERLRPWYHVMLGDPQVIEMLVDKIRFIRFACEKGLPIPRTAILNNRDDAEQAVARLPFPCVLKPPVKTPEWEANTRVKAYQVASRDALLPLYDRCSAWSDTLLLQEWIEGPESELYSCNAYFDAHSNPLVTFVARKLRQWPPGTGTSCLGEECRNDGVLQETVRLFQTAGFHGLAYLEMKRDARTGELVIIEPNVGRPTGRSAIAEAGGVELVYTMYCDATGRPLPEARQQQYRGVKWIYWRRDLQSSWHYWRGGQLTLRQWWRSWRGPKGCAVFSWSDPGPFLADFTRAARLSLERVGRTICSRLLAKPQSRGRLAHGGPIGHQENDPVHDACPTPGLRFE